MTWAPHHCNGPNDCHQVIPNRGTGDPAPLTRGFGRKDRVSRFKLQLTHFHTKKNGSQVGSTSSLEFQCSIQVKLKSKIVLDLGGRRPSYPVYVYMYMYINIYIYIYIFRNITWRGQKTGRTWYSQNNMPSKIWAQETLTLLPSPGPVVHGAASSCSGWGCLFGWYQVRCLWHFFATWGWTEHEWTRVYESRADKALLLGHLCGLGADWTSLFPIAKTNVQLPTTILIFDDVEIYRLSHVGG